MDATITNQIPLTEDRRHVALCHALQLRPEGSATEILKIARSFEAFLRDGVVVGPDEDEAKFRALGSRA